MMRVVTFIKTAAIIPVILLAGCGNQASKELTVSGARTAIVIMRLIDMDHRAKDTKPTAVLGVFSTLYTAQGSFLPASSALAGIEASKKMLAAQATSDTDETFALLQEVGNILNVDIKDMLNRSNNRSAAMDTYVQSMYNVGVLVERKIVELEALLDRQQDERKAAKKVVRDIEKRLRTALRDQDYGQAATLEEELADATPILAEIETKEDRTKDVIGRFRTIQEISIKRLQAVENNRAILISGLRVIEVPGIADLDILQQGRRWSRRDSSQIFGAPR